jgi:hypothetical protein
MAQPWRLVPVIGPFIPQKKLLATFDLASMLQKKDFARLKSLIFHQIVENLVDFRANVCAKSRFFRAL